MSINVFGHIFRKSEGDNRGHPGIGYKITSDGQYNIENKRLCNVGDPKEINDVINLVTLQKEINSLKNDQEKLNIMMGNVNKIFLEKIRNLQNDIITIKEIIAQIIDKNHGT